MNHNRTIVRIEFTRSYNSYVETYVSYCVYVVKSRLISNHRSGIRHSSQPLRGPLWLIHTAEGQYTNCQLSNVNCQLLCNPFVTLLQPYCNPYYP